MDSGVDSTAVAHAVHIVSRRPPLLGNVRLAAIDGPSGSGKTVLSKALAGELNRQGFSVAVVPCDDFATWDRPASWWPQLEQGVLGPLACEEDGRYRALRWNVAGPFAGPYVDIPVPDILIIEGVTSARRSVAARLSLSVWVEWATTLQRLDVVAARDGEQCREPLEIWQAFETGWFAIDGTRERCDVVVVRDTPTFSC